MTFPKKSPKGPGSRPRVLKRHQNGRQRVPKWSPGVSKFNPKAKKNVENLQHSPRVPKRSAGCYNGAPRCHIGAPRSHKCKTHRKCPPKFQKTHTRSYPKVPNKEEKPYTHKHPTNQRNKEGHKETNNRTNTHTHKSFEQQTRTQTPAAGCSPKAT